MMSEQSKIRRQVTCTAVNPIYSSTSVLHHLVFGYLGMNITITGVRRSTVDIEDYQLSIVLAAIISTGSE